ncbi:MAG: excinuclease ABC subunit UvrA, partial [Candidatus Tectomicrobia bacterium]|nr:excinuclease ABC subunit UvrA [Candidatus Tectomicrobia bacterium]
MDEIVIEGAREHNLKNVSVRLPHEHFIVVTGPSGSGKSSLAFDTVYAEGHRRYVESLSTYARQFLERVDKPDVDFIEGISPAIAIEQYNPVKHSRSTVGTASEIYDYLRLLFAKAGQIHCPACGRPVRPATVDSTVSLLLEGFQGARGFVLFPLAPVSPEELGARLAALQAQGFIRFMAEGEVLDIAPGQSDRLLERISGSAKEPRKGRERKAAGPPEPLLRGLRVVADRLAFSAENRARLGESLETAFREGEGVAEVQVVDGP